MSLRQRLICRIKCAISKSNKISNVFKFNINTKLNESIKFKTHSMKLGIYLFMHLACYKEQFILYNSAKLQDSY